MWRRFATGFSRRLPPRRPALALPPSRSATRCLLVGATGLAGAVHTERRLPSPPTRARPLLLRSWVDRAGDFSWQAFTTTLKGLAVVYLWTCIVLLVAGAAFSLYCMACWARELWTFLPKFQ